MSAATRVEHDSLGPVEVPRARYWGAQTQRAIANFAIGDRRMPAAIIHALAEIKRAAAHVNGRAGRLAAPVADAIVCAATEVADGALADEFPLSIWQSGSGTPTHMNVNEVIAGRANELLGHGRGGRAPVHPNDHVNLGQSTNDVFPSAMHLALGALVDRRLMPPLGALADALRGHAAAWADAVKLGRTHLMDATPVTFGQEVGGWATQLDDAARSCALHRPALRALALGGTATGTGLNAPAGFAAAVIEELAARYQCALAPAPDRFAAMAAHDAVVAMSGALRTTAVALMKIGNDVRLLGSGPRGGLAELRLPPNEPGSSIMPGKVNPTQVEALTMVCARVLGNDLAIATGGMLGQLELNAYKPLLAACALESVQLLGDATDSFRAHLVEGLAIDRARASALVERSLMLVTALAPLIGYDAAAQVAAYAHAHDLTVREAARALAVADDALVARALAAAAAVKGA